MASLNFLLRKRLNSDKNESKAATLSERTGSGNLAVFSRAFTIKELSSEERTSIETLLKKYYPDDYSDDMSIDLSELISLTSEVKAINNQAAILHGERIKKAQSILKKYRDGAFTAWLTSTYGNRQTPYNFLQYYEFYQQMPKDLHGQLEAMPRQAIYTLASRSGDLDEKKQLVEKYNGETKMELISHIRDMFPLAHTDKRRANIGEQAIKTLDALCIMIEKNKNALSSQQKIELCERIAALKEIL